MFSRILIKLIDQAIVPAILLLVTRIVSMIFFSKMLNVDFDITNAGFIFSEESSFVLINSYSLLAMILVLTLGIVYILVKSYYLHDTHIDPALTAKLFSLRLSNFIQTSFDLYSQGAVWLSYVYFMFLMSIFLAFTGLAYNWVFFASFMLAIVATVAFVLDIEHEIYTEYDEFDEIMELEEYVLKFGNINE